VLDVGRFCRVSLSSELDARLDFSDRYRRHVQIGIRHSVQPIENGSVRLAFAKFRDDVGIEEIHAFNLLATVTAASIVPVGVREGRVGRPIAAAV